MMDELLQKTRAERASWHEVEAELMASLAAGQHPEALYIGCSDSRILPSRILGAEPGEFFVTRNIANIVPDYAAAQAGETAVAAVLEYAVLHLKVEHIVLCGHTACGGMQALSHAHHLEPGLTAWLHHAEEALARVGADADLDALIAANVLVQLEHLRSYPFIAEAEAAGTLTLHGWIYDFVSGRVRVYDPQQGVWVEEEPF